MHAFVVPVIGRTGTTLGAGFGAVMLVPVAMLLATVLSGCGHHAARAAGPFAGSIGAPPASITVSGSDIPYVGTVPWANAVTPTAAASTLTIYADGDQIGHGVCGLPTERVEVHQDSDSVQILVVGYAHPASTGPICAAVGHSPQPHQVQLAAPLGSRRLVDASNGAAHKVLVAASMPTLSGIPVGYRQVPVTWDEKTGAVTRVWRASTGPSTTPLSVIVFTRAPAGVIQSQDGPHTPSNPDGPDGTLVASGVAVAQDTAQARVWYYTDLHNNRVTARWAGPGGLGYQLITSTPPGGSVGVQQAETLARSAH